MKQEIIRIVITGGPCAGKSTAMSKIQDAFSKQGYTVLFVPETATELITGGVAPWTCGTNLEYQKVQVALQLEKERLFIQAARTMPKEKIMIVCDRGVMDNKAYMTDDEFDIVLDHLNTDYETVIHNYDAVFHLVTAANGAEEFYSFENNAARYETVEQAIALDQRLMNSWSGHTHLRVVDNSYEFDKKMAVLIDEIDSFLNQNI